MALGGYSTLRFPSEKPAKCRHNIPCMDPIGIEDIEGLCFHDIPDMP